MSNEPMRKKASGWGRYGRKFWLILGAITLCGLLLRLICCFWGYPHQLHHSEKVMLGHALDMMSRRSWEAYVYNRPDQFEIKCIAIIYFIFSHLTYHMSAGEAYLLHTAAFHTVARIFISCFGVAMIPLTALFIGKLLERDSMKDCFKQTAQLLAAGITAFFPIFVQNSAYFDPDIPLACMSLLVAYLSLFYLESGSRRLLCAMAVLIGISVSIKYPAALMSGYLAIIVIYRAVRRHERGVIVRSGFLSAGLVLLTMFIIAPNLFTNIRATASTFLHEARPTHLGADGLGFGGNLLYYFKEVMGGVGFLSLPLFLAGAIYLIAHRDQAHLGMGMFGIYWVCMSVLSLHWERWGMPMYGGYIMLAAIGFAWLLELLSERLQSRRLPAACARGALCLCAAVLCANVILSGAALCKWSLAPDTRVVAQEACDQFKLTEENTLHEGYTPFDETGVYFLWKEFELGEDGELKVADEHASKRYFMMSSSGRDRYLAEPERYEQACAVYNALDENFERIYCVEGEEFETETLEPVNIAKQLRYLTGPSRPTGDDILVYDMQSPAAQ